MIEEILPSSKSRIKLVETIFKIPGININGLIKKTGSSPNFVIDYVNKLVEKGVLKEKRIGGEEKSHIRLSYPNLNSDNGLIVFSFVEKKKREEFINKYEEFGPIVKQIADLYKDFDIDFILVYGSFARFSADESSDVDILIVSEELTKDKGRRFGEVFVSLGREYSIKIESIEKFIKNLDGALHQNIIEDHVILKGERKFLETLAKSDFFIEKF